MRLDKFLKVSRIIKRRTVANQACDAGKISVGGNTARASYQVKEGDIIEIKMGARIIKIEVLNICETAKKEQADAMYREIS